MVPSVTTVLQRFKTEWAAQLQPEALPVACAAVGSTAWRDRLLNPVITVQVLLFQILHGHTACRHLPHLAGVFCTAFASCQSRATLPFRVLDHLLERRGQSVHSTVSAEGRWHGHRTLFVDGSGCAMPDTPVRRSAASKGLPRSRWIRAFSTHDQLVEWCTPRTCPPWRSPDALEALPPSLVVRELRYAVTQRGFRSRQLTVVTTWLAAERSPAADVAALSGRRWEADTPLDQRTTTMKMDMLHGKTVLGVHKALLVFAIL